MSKQNRRGFKPNALKKINFQIKQILWYAKSHLCGFPQNDRGKRVYHDEIQKLREQKTKLINQN